MRVYCSTVISDANIAEVRRLNMGVLLCSSPAGFLPSKKLAGIPVACDNGAFGAWKSGYWFDEFAFLRLLSHVRRIELRPEWVVAPDLVARGRESLAFSLAWCARMPDVPFALAVQDGMTPALIQSHAARFRCIFVGGTVDWKWETAPQWVSFAHEHGLVCHIGRVGDVDRLARAERIGADSCDSTNFNRASTKKETRAGVGAWHRVEAFQRGDAAPDLFEEARAVA